jgi:hypothetical protein
MPITTILPSIAGLALVAFLVITIGSGDRRLRGGWMLPAVLSFTFFVFSTYTGTVEGPLGFWVEHTRNLWGNQIWFDLLLSTSIGWLFMVPQARAVGMRLPVWLVLIAATGNIGFMAMLARMLWLREQTEKHG